MSTHVKGWTTIAENPQVLVREYAFGPGLSNAMAVELPGGKLMVVSPPIGVPEAELRELGAIGDVVALVANNGGHHLGLGPTRAAFPKAVTYAAPAAAERIRSKGKDPGELEPVEALVPLLGDKVRVHAIDGCKVGDVVIWVKTEKGAVFYAGDFIANIQKPPGNLIFRLVFRLTDSAPGFKVFKLFFKFFVKDRAAAREHLIRELEANAPTILVPSHGDVITRSDLAPTLVSMLRAAV
jgi:glyoxylase-like metal-dependent hydrolase (beta-lactamase superfamily II)